MIITSIASVILVCVGAFFFVAGTIGLLRFPDLHARVHALTKADNLGLGFIATGLVLQAESAAVGAKLVLIWVLALAAAATSGFLIAKSGLEERTPDRDHVA